MLSRFAWQTPKLSVTCDNAMDLGLEPGLPSWALHPTAAQNALGRGNWKYVLEMLTLLFLLFYTSVRQVGSAECCINIQIKRLVETLRASELLKPAFRLGSRW